MTTASKFEPQATQQPAQVLRTSLQSKGYHFVPGLVQSIAGDFWEERRYRELPLIADHSYEELRFDAPLRRSLELRQLPDGDIGLFQGESFEAWTINPGKLQEIEERRQISGYRWHADIASAIISTDKIRALSVTGQGFGFRFISATEEIAPQYYSVAPETGLERGKDLYKYLVEVAIPFIGKYKSDLVLELAIGLVDAMGLVPQSEWCTEIRSGF